LLDRYSSVVVIREPDTDVMLGNTSCAETDTGARARRRRAIYASAVQRIRIS